jgi:hypothetical protein
MVTQGKMASVSAKKKSAGEPEPAKKKRDSTDDNDEDHPNKILKQEQEKAEVQNSQSCSPASSSCEFLDIESALQYIVNIPADEDGLSCSANKPEQEYLDTEKRFFVTWRAAHSGDASTITNLYNKSIRKESPTVQTNNTNTTTTAGETTDGETTTQDAQEDETRAYLWLAEGLGDEDTPPSVYSLLGYVSDEKSREKVAPKLGVIAIITIGWDKDNKRGRVLRLEWLYIDTSLHHGVMDNLQRRLWLRLSLLSTLTKCEMLLVEKKSIVLPKMYASRFQVRASPE